MNVQDFLNGFLGSIPVAAVAIFLVRHFINNYDKEHETSRESIGDILKEINQLKISIAEIKGDIREAISVKDRFNSLEKDVWAVGSQVTAAWKWIDSKEKK